MGKRGGAEVRRERFPYGAVAVGAALLCSCGATSAQSTSVTADAVGAAVKNLAAGRVDSLPTGPVYLQVNAFAQPAGGLIGSKKHVAGIIMQADGAQRLEVEGSPPLDIHAGEGAFLPSITHAHLNPGPGANHWFNLALWPSSARAAPLTSPGVTVAFTTPDLPADTLPPGAYVMTLQMVTLQPHGRTQAHTYGGIDVVFVLSGIVTEHVDGRSATRLAADGASYALANTGLQEVDDTAQPATFLSFVVAPVGQPFETALNRSP